MDLWIRSQDKSSLYKVTAIYIEKKEYGQKHHYIFTKNEDCLGMYKTEERALQVLDEIQGILKPKGIIKLDGMYKPKDIERIREKYNSKHYFIADNEIETIQMPETIVYEMPEE